MSKYYPRRYVIKDNINNLSSKVLALKRNLTNNERKLNDKLQEFEYNYIPQVGFFLRYNEHYQPYVLDFYSDDLRIGIELQGRNHYTGNNKRTQKTKDKRELFERYRIPVYELKNSQINKLTENDIIKYKDEFKLPKNAFNENNIIIEEHYGIYILSNEEVGYQDSNKHTAM